MGGSTFPTVYLMKSRYQLRIFNENLLSEWRCDVSIKYTPDSWNLLQENIKYVINNFNINYILTFIYVGLSQCII